jgi:hypothetical protein
MVVLTEVSLPGLLDDLQFENQQAVVEVDAGE